MEYRINNTTLKYDVIGSRHWGEERTLLKDAIDLTENTPWHETGFIIEQLFEPKTYAVFARRTKSLLLKCWRSAGLAVDENFEPDQYHTLIHDYKTHLAAVEKTRLLQVSDFPVPVQQMEERISEICSVPLIAKNPFDGQSIFHFRVIRPGQTDNNPLHRDVWLEDYDDCINLYIPVAGSNTFSSLIIIPGSHLWPESRVEKTDSGADVGGVKFNVPAVTALKGDYSVMRPDPGTNQVLIFSPYLIHGGAVNLNTDKTRVSIEMRLWKK
jgi:Phytanoyl-CoA dioxygenase (PhyH)